MGIPRQVLLLCLILAATGIAAAWLGWANWLTEVEYDPYSPVQESNAVNGNAILIGALCIVAAILVLTRAKVAAFAAITTGTAALGAIILVIPPPFPAWIFGSLDDSNPWMLPINFLIEPRILWMYFIAALSIAYLGWLTITRNPEWFRLSPSGEITAKAHGNMMRTAGVIFLAGVVWLLLKAYGPMSILSLTAMPWDTIGMVGAFDGVLAFFAATCILITLLNERVDVDDTGVRISLAPTGWRIFNAPWKHVRRVDMVRHHVSPPSAAIRMWFLGFIPSAFVVHARRYRDGINAVEKIGSIAVSNQKKVANWRVTDNALLIALTLAAWGCFGIVYVGVTHHLDWIEMSKTNYPPANFEAIAAPVYFGALNVLSLGCFGAALGVSSAFHRAAARPFLIAFFLCALAYTAPDNIIHWLVWIAIFHIYMAIPGQDPNSVVPHPTWQEWNIGMTLSTYAPVFAVGFYLLAVVVTSRHDRSRNSNEVGQSHVAA